MNDINTERTPNTVLHGRKLWVARAVFGLMAGLMLLVGAASFYVYFTRDGWQICEGSTIECQVKLQYSTVQAADFARHDIPFETVVALRYAALLLSSIVSISLGLFIAVRRSDDWMALLMALVLVQLGSIGNEGVASSLTRAQPELTVLVGLLNSLSIPLLMLTLGLFPNGRPVPAWMRIALPVAFVLVLVVTLIPPSNIQWVVLTNALVVIAVLGLLLYSQIVRYRRFSTFAERKQTKWAVTGFVLFLLTFMIGILLFSVDPFGDNQLLKAIVGTLCFTLLPGVFLSVFLAIAILKSRLWDIDVIIRRTLTYGLVTALLLVVFFGSVVVLQQLFAGLTGQGQNEIVTVLSTLAIAALFVPLRNWVQGAIDRRFNRKKYDAQQVLTDFATTVRDETDLEKLTARLIQVVDETMQPTSVSMWLKQDRRPRTISQNTIFDREG